ncbi:MAG: DUF669 domain-containing protein [Bullifex sp.]
MAIDFNKFDEIYNVSADEVKQLDQNGGRSYENVPHGKYEVKVDTLELGESKKGEPMLIGRFRILTGNYKGQLIFMNKLVSTSMQVHYANEFLRSLDSRVGIEWTGSYQAYADLIDRVFDAVNGKLEYGLYYGSDNKGYPVFEIVEVFE